jgi:hypothetical protein
VTRRTVPFVVVGWGLMAVGALAVVRSDGSVPPLAFGRWLVGLAVVHDLVVAPVVFVVGFLLHKAPLPAARATVVRALVVIAIVVLFSWPLVAGWGRAPANPSIQPRDYGDGLAWVLAAVILVVAAPATWRACRRWRASSRGASR